MTTVRPSPHPGPSTHPNLNLTPMPLQVGDDNSLMMKIMEGGEMRNRQVRGP